VTSSPNQWAEHGHDRPLIVLILLGLVVLGLGL
jgi:hypothetical protein